MTESASRAPAAAALVVRTRGPDETRALGERLGRGLRAGDLVALSGDLGAGKTTLAQGIARGLGVAAHVSSPTFTFVREYRGRATLYHVDLYRIDRPEQAADLALDEVAGGQGVVVVEWPERAPGVLPAAHLLVTIRFAGDDARDLTFTPAGARYEALVCDLAREPL